MFTETLDPVLDLAFSGGGLSEEREKGAEGKIDSFLLLCALKYQMFSMVR